MRTLDQFKKDAKRWLRALQSGDEQARTRLVRVHPGAPAYPTLRDIQHAIALERGFAGWTALKTQLGAIGRGSHAITLIQPEELRSARPYGSWQSRGCDVWDAIVAARMGDADTLRRLLDRDPNLSKYSEPLHFAVREGHVETVRVLLKAGAAADVSSPDGESLATVARDRGHDDVVEIVERAKSSSIRTAPADVDAGPHPPHAATVWNDVDGVRRLLDADPALVHRG